MALGQIKRVKMVFLGKLWSIYAKIGGKLQSDRIVYILKDEAKLVAKISEGAHIRTFNRREELDDNVKTALLNLLGAKYLDVLERLFSENARLYVLVLDSELASLIWTKYGKNIRRWMIPLLENDVVFFAGYTNPKLRGQRLWGQVITGAHAIERERASNFYTDCNINNLPSRRQFERTGFEIVARTKLPDIKK